MREAAGLLSRSLARVLGRTFPRERAEEAAFRAMEAVFAEAGFREAVRPPGVTRPGVNSRYLAVEAKDGGGGRAYLVAWLDRQGAAGAAAMTVEQSRSSGLFHPLRRFRGVERGVLGPTPFIAAFRRGLRAPGGVAYAVYTFKLRGLLKGAHSALMAELDRALGGALEALASLPREPGACDPSSLLESLGWSVEAAVGGYVRALRGPLDGGGFAAIVLPRGEDVKGGLRVLEGAVVRERSYVEACGAGVELVAEAYRASGILQAAREAGLSVEELGGRASLRTGGVRLEVESVGFSTACPVPGGEEPYVEALQDLARPIRDLPLVCEYRGEVWGAVVLVGEGAVVRARLGSLSVATSLEGPGVLAVAPMEALAVALATPEGVEVLRQHGGPMVLEEPGYRFP